MSNETDDTKLLINRRNALTALGLSAAGLSITEFMIPRAHASGQVSEAELPHKETPGKYTVLNPQGIRQSMDRVPLSPRIGNLDGKVVYFVSQDKPVYTEELAKRFSMRVPGAKTVFKKKPGWVSSDDLELRDEVKQKADAMVYGTAMGGGSGMYAVGWIREVEKHGIPSMYVVGEYFVPDVKASADMWGIPALRTVVTPLVGEDRVKQDMTDEKYDEIISGIISALTKPLTEEEKKGGKIFTEKPQRIAMTGTLDEVQDYFNKNGWSDGLPVIPPAEELVNKMLKGTSHSPDEVVTSSMHPEELTVTVEKTAVVGVMAGCRPEYMPVLLALIETWGNPMFTHSTRSDSSMTLMTFLNGPIRNEIKMNPSTNALGPGNQANAAIGRFLSLATIALGGSVPIANNLSTIGTPTRYCFCFPEHEEKSPWEPFHVSMGYKPQESVVSLCSGGWCHWSFMGDLDLLARAVAGFYWSNRGGIILMAPGAARLYASKGMSKADVERYIQKKAVPLMEDQTPTWFLFDQPAPSRSDNEPSKGSKEREDPRGSVKVIVVGGETMIPCAQAWQFNPPITTGVDKWR